MRIFVLSIFSIAGVIIVRLNAASFCMSNLIVSNEISRTACRRGASEAGFVEAVSSAAAAEPVALSVRAGGGSFDVVAAGDELSKQPVEALNPATAAINSETIDNSDLSLVMAK